MMGLGCHEMYCMIHDVYLDKLLDDKEHQLEVGHQTLQEEKKTLDIVAFKSSQQGYKGLEDQIEFRKKIQSTRCALD